MMTNAFLDFRAIYLVNQSFAVHLGYLQTDGVDQLLVVAYIAVFAWL